MMSFFESVAKLPQDPIFKLPVAFNSDPRSCKVNLGVGTYRDAEGRTPIFSSVKKAERSLMDKESSKEYLPIQGLPAFIHACSDLVFGSGISSEKTREICTVQTLGGTGALRLGGDFLVRAMGRRTIYLPDPTWPNHGKVFGYAGMDVHHYNYYDKDVQNVDFREVSQKIGSMEPEGIVLLHVCCHNPTGCDFSTEQWQELSALIKKRRVIPFFDMAYQGFGEGVEEDVFPIRYFAAKGHEMLVANSLSKNFGMYSERIGSLSIVAEGEEAAGRISSQLKQLIRSNYSNPPRHGAQIVADVLQSAALKNEWLEELSGMCRRLTALRRRLVAGLQDKCKGKDWSFLARQKGFFAYCGFTAEETGRLIKNYGIYVPDDGRINISGLNENNLDYVVQAISSVVHL